LISKRAMTTVVAGTSDLGAVTCLKPVDRTTNPTIVLKAVDTPEYRDVVDEALAWDEDNPAMSRVEMPVGDGANNAFWTTIPHAYRKHVQTEFLISLAASDAEGQWAGRTRGRLDV
jgi:transaldolase